MSSISQLIWASARWRPITKRAPELFAHERLSVPTGAAATQAALTSVPIASRARPWAFPDACLEDGIMQNRAMACRAFSRNVPELGRAFRADRGRASRRATVIAQQPAETLTTANFCVRHDGCSRCAILTTGASFSLPKDAWFESACLKACPNRHVSRHEPSRGEAWQRQPWREPA